MTKSFVIIALAVVLTIAACEANIIGDMLKNVNLDCDPVPLQQNFSLSDYTGQWYEIYRSKSMPFESGTDNTAMYTANADGTVGVHNKEWIPAKKQWNDAFAVATVKQDSPAHLAVQFYNPPSPVAGDYRVLSTDYKTYAVVYSCSKFVVQVKFGWLLARQDQLPQEVVDHAFTYFNAVGLQLSDFTKTQHGVAPHS